MRSNGTSPLQREGVLSEAAMGSAPESAAHAMRAAHRGTMMPAHGRTAIAPAAQEGESPIPRTTEQRRQDQDDDDEAQHWLGPPFVFCGKGHLCKKTCITVTRNASLAFSLEPDALASADGLQPRSRVWLLPCYDDSVSDSPDI